MRRRMMFGGKKEIVPIDDGYVWAYYVVNSTDAPTVLFNRTTSIDELIIDGEESIIETSYQFSTVGVHLVKYKFSQGITQFPALLLQGVNTYQEIYLPSQISSVGNYFANNVSVLRKVHFFGTLTNVGSYCFTNCPIEELNWENYSASNDVTFRGHKLRGDIVINEGITSCPRFSSPADAANLPNARLFLPSTLTSIRDNFCEYWTNLIEITCKAITPPPCGNYSFRGLNNLAHIYVPAESVEAYKATSGWSSYANIISAIN